MRCGEPIPDAYGYQNVPQALCCKRRHGHPGRHRVVFKDKGVREWESGDRESVLTKQGEA